MDVEVQDDLYFRPNSTDELIAGNLRWRLSPLGCVAAPSDACAATMHRDGDVLLISKRCSSLSPFRALLCYACKYGISGDGKGAWDHAAMVFTDRPSSLPMLLEGDGGGVRLRTFEERLMQGTDHLEITLLPLRGSDSSSHGGRRLKLSSFIQASAPSPASPARAPLSSWLIVRTTQHCRILASLAPLMVTMAQAPAARTPWLHTVNWCSLRELEMRGRHGTWRLQGKRRRARFAALAHR